MIDGSQHRIGNLVSYKGEAVRIEAISKILCNVSKFKHYEDQLEHDIDNFDPIRLSKEWLEKFGFEFDDDGNRRDRYIKDDFAINEFEGVWYFNVFYTQGKERIEVRYVHQLQNLYHSLTNTELKIGS